MRLERRELRDREGAEMGERAEGRGRVGRP